MWRRLWRRVLGWFRQDPAVVCARKHKVNHQCFDDFLGSLPGDMIWFCTECRRLWHTDNTRRRPLPESRVVAEYTAIPGGLKGSVFDPGIVWSSENPVWKGIDSRLQAEYQKYQETKEVTKE